MNQKYGLIAMSAILGLAFFATGCNQTLKTPNGKIPSPYLQYAQPLLGKYAGDMESRSAILELKLDGDRPVLTSNVDLLGNSCNSKIGALKQITVSDWSGKTVVSNAIFEFDPGNCTSIMGRTLVIDLSDSDGKITFDVSLLDHVEWISNCEPNLPPNPRACDYQDIGVYLSGRFSKN